MSCPSFRSWPAPTAADGWLFVDFTKTKPFAAQSAFPHRRVRCRLIPGGVVIEPFHIPDMTTTLRCFSFPAQDETMAPLGSHERDRSLSGTERWMRRRTCLKPKARNRPLRVRVAPRMRRKSLSEPKARNRPLRVRAASRSAIPPRSGATGSSVGWVRAGSDGSILLTTMTSIAPSPSRCQTRNESPTPRMWKRFSIEARILAKLDHPHIVPVIDVGRTEDGLCFVVSKLIEGSDLAVRIGQARPSFRDSAELVATDRRRTSLRPHPRAGPPGHQARQHPDRRLGQTVSSPISGLPSRTRTSARVAGWLGHPPT